MQYLSENQPLLSLVPSMALTQIIQIWLSPPLTAMPLQLACCLAPRNVVQPPPRTKATGAWNSGATNSLPNPFLGLSTWMFPGGARAGPSENAEAGWGEPLPSLAPPHSPSWLPG